jgi:glycolate oxidase
MTLASTRSALEEFCRLAAERIGSEYVILDGDERRAYACDGLTSHQAVPAVVVLPGAADEIEFLVRELVRLGVPYVARGAGTGLSGGALPEEDGALIVTARLKRILEIDPIARLAVVEPGVINLELSRAAAPYGLYFAPDPSSQIACSIGGNVAENSGGSHCFKYGFTTNHVLGIDVVTATGERVFLGAETLESPGPDLRGLFIGSEGTLGIAVDKVAEKNIK